MIIDAIVFEDPPGSWVAQCIPFDIGAESATKDNIDYELSRTLAGHVSIDVSAGMVPFRSLPAAPQEFADRYAALIRKSPFEFDRTSECRQLIITYGGTKDGGSVTVKVVNDDGTVDDGKVSEWTWGPEAEVNARQ